ncbi:MAG: COX15/CtaA family protein [Bdellovibrionales bacterium]|nr:COX15/CtaA family protein [Bdellovibrionales bacterium]
MKQQNKTFSFFCLFTLCFCLLVILWGAWVRISHSGDGCGQSWPSCQGQYLIDSGEQQKTWIEWIHRATSSLFGIMVIWLFIWSFLKFPFRHPVSKSVLCIFLFTISEALIGAGLVLAGLTGDNTSPARVLVMNLHLLNSVLLVSSLFICWRLSLGKKFSFFNRMNEGSDRLSKALFLFVFFLIAFFGSVSSLASSLFPSPSLLEGLALDFNPDSPWLIRLRWLHPFLALSFGGAFLYYYFFQDKREKGTRTVLQKIFIVCVSLTLFSGLMNLLLLSPVFLKLVHLLIVYLLVMSFILTLECSIERIKGYFYCNTLEEEGK